MEFLGIKISVWLAILVGALIRVLRIPAKSQTKFGRFAEIVIVFAVSIFCGFALLGPVMTFFAIPVAYELIVAMLLALSAELFVTKVLRFMDEHDLPAIVDKVKDWVSKK